MPITVEQCDITKLETQVIVNSVNTALMGGGGVDGAIHRAAGPELLEECKEHGGCPHGEVRVTKGYKLNCEYIFHTAGPIWRGGTSYEEVQLRNCYVNCMRELLKHEKTQIAFPCISTGIYGYPKEEAAKIAISVVSEFVKAIEDQEKDESLHLNVKFVCFEDDNYKIYKNLLGL